MTGYVPLKITGNTTGLVQEREEFILPDDAYPVLQNAYVWREKIKRKNAFETLGRLRRIFDDASLGSTVGAQLTYTFANIFTTLGIVGEPDAEIQPGTLVITIAAPDAATFTDQGDGTFAVTGAGVALGSSVNYVTGAVTIVLSASAGGSAITADLGYFPNLPVMGLRIRELQNSAFDQTIAWDTKYAYEFTGVPLQWQEFLPGTTWTGTDSDFFWTTNYFVGDLNLKIFWATNFVDPIRYTNGQVGTNWVDFTPQINASGDTLQNALALLPFRGRLVAFNTIEFTGGGNRSFTNRIRWSKLGTPFTVPSAIVTLVNPDAWRDDIRGHGGFLDIPTSEDIISVGFVRDNLVIYCERSTWQLRYTGRSIAPFQIEKVNSELGAESTFSTVQFDTSLVGIGDKGIVECDSYKSQLIDIKIPDLVFNQFQNSTNGTKRVYGIRNFEQRLAYWIYPDISSNGIFPDRRLVYNYENDSWGIYTDSLTCLGTFQSPNERNWLNTPIPWIKCNFPWIKQQLGTPSIVGGNQQGYVFVLDQLTTNDPSLFIQNIIPHTTTATQIVSPNHNLQTDAVIKITGIPAGTPYDNLNDGIFAVVVSDANNFTLYKYDSTSQQFSTPQLDVPNGDYIGGGEISVRDNFNITSKKFNFLDEGESIQIGYIDILMPASGNIDGNPDDDGAISLNVYADYNDSQATNTLPQNVIPGQIPISSDTFFNQIIPTTQSSLNTTGGTKFWQRVICPTRAAFLTLQYTFSNAQMAGKEQEIAVQIDAQVLWIRKAGRLTQI